MELEGALCFFEMLRSRTSQGISSFTQKGQRSSFLADDEVEELSFLSFVFLGLEEPCLVLTRSELPSVLFRGDGETFIDVST